MQPSNSSAGKCSAADVWCGGGGNPECFGCGIGSRRDSRRRLSGYRRLGFALVIATAGGQEAADNDHQGRGDETYDQSGFLLFGLFVLETIAIAEDARVIGRIEPGKETPAVILED